MNFAMTLRVRLAAAELLEAHGVDADAMDFDQVHAERPELMGFEVHQVRRLVAAARRAHAFDEATGEPVGAVELAAYCAALRAQPDTPFLVGERVCVISQALEE